MNFWTQSPKNIFVAGHRGWPAKYPENTLVSFAAAIDAGVDQIETDVRCTADGALVLIHDALVDRTTNGTGRIEEMTLEAARALDAGAWKDPSFAGCKIPTWEEFLTLIEQHPTLTLDIELKEYPIEGNEERAYTTCDRVIADLDARGMTERTVLNTFSGKLHEYIQTKYGDRIRRHVYFPERYLGEVTEDPYAHAYCCCMFSQEKGKRMATAEEYAAMAARGVQPWAGAGVRDAEGVDEAIACGAFLITCNNPDEILALLRARGRHV